MGTCAKRCQCFDSSRPEGKTYYQQRLGNYQMQLKKLHSDAQAAFNAVPAANVKS